MGQFVTLIKIKTKHSYYFSTAGKFNISSTASSSILLYKRGIVIRPATDGCELLITDDYPGFAEGDELDLILQIRDENFMYITQLDHYSPQSFYRLTLPEDSREIDVVSALVSTNEPKGGNVFCNIRIKLTENMLEKAKHGTPLEYLFLFREAAYRWEYLFFPRCEENEGTKTFLLEDTLRQIFFTLSEKPENTSFGRKAWRFVSTSSIACKENQPYNLQLSEVLTTDLSELLSKALSRDIQPKDLPMLSPEVLQEVLPKILADKSLKKRIVSRYLPCPQPGRFVTKEQGYIRQICYV